MDVDNNVITVEPTLTVRALLDRVKDRRGRQWTWVVVPMPGGGYAVTRMSEIAQDAAEEGGAILDMALADIPGLLKEGPALESTSNPSQAQGAAAASPGHRIPVLQTGAVIGVFEPGRTRSATPLPLDLWQLTEGGSQRFKWPYDELKLSNDMIVLGPETPVQVLAARLSGMLAMRVYLVVPWDNGTYRVMQLSNDLDRSLPGLGPGAGQVPVRGLAGLSNPVPGLEEESVPWKTALQKVASAPGKTVVILRQGKPAGVLADTYRGLQPPVNWARELAVPKGIEPLRPPPGQPPHGQMAKPPLHEAAPMARQPERRYSDVDLPARTSVGTQFDMQVALTIEPQHADSVALDFNVPRPDKPFEVDVYLMYSPTDLSLDGPFHRRLTVQPGGNSNTETFKLTPLTEGPKELSVHFHYDGQYIGSAVARTIAVGAGQAVAGGPRAEVSGGKLGAIGRPPDITLTVTEVQSERRAYRFLVTTPLPELAPDPNSLERPGDWIVELSDTPESYINSLMRDLNTWRATPSGDASRYEVEIESRGAYLYEKLFPKGLKDWYWGKVAPRLAQNTATSLLIVSSEPWIPWEIVRPSEPGHPGKFLCDSFMLGRWIVPEPPPPDRIDLDSLGLIVPPSDLQSAADEASRLKSLLGDAVQNISPCLMDVMEAMKSSAYHGLHVVGHGRFQADNPELSRVPLADGDWTPDRIAGEYKTLFQEEHPLVFMNACEIAQRGFALSGLGGWAPALVAAGTSAFLGSAWRVSDALAGPFALAFYQALGGQTADGKPVPLGQAVHDARTSIRAEGSTDPSWLSYALYGHPLAEVHLPPLSMPAVPADIQPQPGPARPAPIAGLEDRAATNAGGAATIQIVGLRGTAGDRYGSSRGVADVVEQAVSVDKLRQKLGQFLAAVQEMLASDEPKGGPFQLAQIQLSAEITAEGDFKLMGTGVGVSAGSAITFVLERKPAEGKHDTD